MLLTVSEAAERLRVSVRTVEREAAAGRIALVRIRSRRLIDQAELARYIAGQQEGACRYASEEIAIRSASASAAVSALSALCRSAPRSPTRAPHSGVVPISPAHAASEDDRRQDAAHR